MHSLTFSCNARRSSARDANLALAAWSAAFVCCPTARAVPAPCRWRTPARRASFAHRAPNPRARVHTVPVLSAGFPPPRRAPKQAPGSAPLPRVQHLLRDPPPPFSPGEEGSSTLGLARNSSTALAVCTRTCENDLAALSPQDKYTNSGGESGKGAFEPNDCDCCIAATLLFIHADASQKTCGRDRCGGSSSGGTRVRVVLCCVVLPLPPHVGLGVLHAGPSV